MARLQFQGFFPCPLAAPRVDSWSTSVDRDPHPSRSCRSSTRGSFDPRRRDVRHVATCRSSVPLGTIPALLLTGPVAAYACNFRYSLPFFLFRACLFACLHALISPFGALATMSPRLSLTRAGGWPSGPARLGGRRLPLPGRGAQDRGDSLPRVFTESFGQLSLSRPRLERREVQGLEGPNKQVLGRVRTGARGDLSDVPQCSNPRFTPQL